MERAADRGDTPDRAALVGRLLGHEAAWEHQGIGLQTVCVEAELAALARSRWEAEGQRLAGPDADFGAFLAGFLDAYGAAWPRPPPRCRPVWRV